MDSVKFTVTLKGASEAEAIVAGNAIWATLKGLDSIAPNGLDFSVAHNGPDSLSSKLNQAWRDDTDVNWT
jgi:hypothetical protein